MKKVSIVFSQREDLWKFIGLSHGVNISIHHKLQCVTADFPEEEVELAKANYKAQVFESIYTASQTDKVLDTQKEKPTSVRLSGTWLL